MNIPYGPWGWIRTSALFTVRGYSPTPSTTRPPTGHKECSSILLHFYFLLSTSLFAHGSGQPCGTRIRYSAFTAPRLNPFGIRLAATMDFVHALSGRPRTRTSPLSGCDLQSQCAYPNGFDRPHKARTFTSEEDDGIRTHLHHTPTLSQAHPLQRCRVLHRRKITSQTHSSRCETKESLDCGS